MDYISRPFDKSVVRRRVINTLMLYGKQKHLMRMITEQVYRREKSNRLMTGILSHIVEFRNAESGPHVQHIQTVSELLLRQLARKTDRYALTEDDIALISTASALHDIGKISIPDSILNKPGKLTAEEFEVVKTHAAVGASILQNLPMTQDEPLIQVAYQICRWHHERYDGHGYPDGFSSATALITAQVVSLAGDAPTLTGERLLLKSLSARNRRSDDSKRRMRCVQPAADRVPARHSGSAPARNRHAAGGAQFQPRRPAHLRSHGARRRSAL